jgi:outer membrane receptor protein involved in Fe transport
MSASRRAISVSRLTFLNAVLMTTAFTVPAYAQIETVVVTAERRAEDIQTVPIAVTALTGADLKARQVTNFRDLQFHVPSVTYTKSNFGGAQFQIRGITTQFGLGAAIAQNFNDIYLEAPGLVTGEYYDVARVEVARGPQSTSYGRAATGGAVNVITEKADLNNFAARASIDYGEFNTIKPDAMVNIPIIDGELAVRLAVHADFHDGYDRNAYAGPQIYPGTPVRNRLNSLGIVFGRASVRWEPSPDTTIDFVADTSYENDRRTRGDKQQCHRDPSGVMGCLPDRLGFDAPNANSLFGTVIGSAQGLTAVLNTGFGFPYGAAQFLGNTMGLGKVAGNCGPGDPNAAGILCTSGAMLGFRATTTFPFVAAQTPELVNGPGSNPGGIVAPALNVSNTAYNPKYKTSGGVYLINWQQKIVDWLSATVDAGYANGYQFTQQDYFDGTPENISPLITQAVAGFNGIISPGLTPIYDSVLFNVPGALPVSNTHYVPGRYDNYNGSIDYKRGGILMKSPFNSVYDEDWYSSREWTGEVRFQTAFDGPLNFSAGLFYMTFNGENQYWVAFTGGDWASTSIGALAATFTPVPAPLMDQTPDYAGESRKNMVESRSAFLEGTYDVLPDELKVIAGARFNDDREHYLRSSTGAELLGAGFGVLGSSFFPTFNTLCPSSACLSPQLWPVSKPPVNTTDLWTGRVSLNWTPKLDWTQQTLVYLTASRGELAGGVNVINNTTVSAAPAVFHPATVDALELGTKNTLLDGTLQANLTAWYYNYENYQVGIIANRSALTLNIPAHLFGLEGEFVWQPTEELAFNATISLTQSEAGHAFIQDQRNPLTGPGGVPVPGAILVKDLTNGANCVIVPITPAAFGHTPGESSAFHVNNFWLPNGGNAAIDTPFGVPLVNYGLCTGTTVFGVTPGPGSIRAQLQAAGFDYAPAIGNQRTGGPFPNPGDTSLGGGILRDGTGFARDLHGNNLPQVPFGQVGVGAQYTWKLDAGYSLVPRVDYYWQSSMQSRVWNDLNIDRMNAWDVMNMQIQLNAPDNRWYAQVFAKNLFDKHNPTGVYLTDATSALFTNVFAEDPRVIGFALGTSW